jgi:hypothetical protein
MGAYSGWSRGGIGRYEEHQHNSEGAGYVQAKAHPESAPPPVWRYAGATRLCCERGGARRREACSAQPTPVSEEIPLSKVGGVYTLPVAINGVLTLHCVLDSGAADVQIPAEVALTLYRTRTIRETDFLPGKTYVLADGSTVRSSRFLLRSLTVGRQRLTDVLASIGAHRSVPLLGQSFLKRLAAWSIDNRREVLMITSPAAGAQSAQGLESIRSDGRATPSPTKPPTTLVVSPLRLSS